LFKDLYEEEQRIIKINISKKRIKF